MTWLSCACILQLAYFMLHMPILCLHLVTCLLYATHIYSMPVSCNLPILHCTCLFCACIPSLAYSMLHIPTLQYNNTVCTISIILYLIQYTSNPLLSFCPFPPKHQDPDRTSDRVQDGHVISRRGLSHHNGRRGHQL